MVEGMNVFFFRMVTQLVWVLTKVPERSDNSKEQFVFNSLIHSANWPRKTGVADQNRTFRKAV